MAGDRSQKTEAPTAKRKKESRKKGQVAKSATLVSWVSLLVATFVIPAVAKNVGDVLADGVRSVDDIAASPDPGTLLHIMSSLCRDAFGALVPLFLAAVVLGVVGNLAQVGFIFTSGPLKPKFERVSPLAGFKRLFSVKALWETGKQIVTIAVILAVAAPGVIGLVNTMVGSSWSLSTGLTMLYDGIVKMTRLVAGVGCVIGVADFAWQKFNLTRDNKMTKEEVKREARESEGDPHLKAKLRSNQAAVSRNRMLASVGDADVVITNPTHFAVALKYDPTKGAPRVVARGADTMASRIRERARASDVPLVESPPLARVLYRSCHVDDEIPAALFHAVATVLAFLRRVERNSLTAKSFVLAVPDTWTPSGDDPETSLTRRRVRPSARAARSRRPTPRPRRRTSRRPTRGGASVKLPTNPQSVRR